MKRVVLTVTMEVEDDEPVEVVRSWTKIVLMRAASGSAGCALRFAEEGNRVASVALVPVFDGRAIDKATLRSIVERAHKGPGATESEMDVALEGMEVGFALALKGGE